MTIRVMGGAEHTIARRSFRRRELRIYSERLCIQQSACTLFVIRKSVLVLTSVNLNV